jgi:hypothetical protein
MSNHFALSDVHGVAVVETSEQWLIYHSFLQSTFPQNTNIKMWPTQKGSKNTGFCNKVEVG